ncbi:MAG TPA: periplasmic heavy metal sensor [Myxococcota bacterium]|nr:periplasmic heavy metal sensor [Myxococcota bacterium]
MSRKTWIGIGALAAGLLATATSAGAFGRHGGMPGMLGVEMLEHRIERMDLPADVRAKAFAIVDASRGEERATREQIRAAHEQLREMVKAGAPDAKALDKQIEEVGALRTQQHKQFLHALIRIGALLPTDQRAQWFEPPHPGGRWHGGK